MKAIKSVAFGTLRISTQNATKVYQKRIIKSIRLNIRIGTLFFFNQKASLNINSALCAQFLTRKVAEEIYRPSPIAKDGLEILLSVEFQISDQKRKYLERMREIVELNYI